MTNIVVSKLLKLLSSDYNKKVIHKIHAKVLLKKCI